MRTYIFIALIFPVFGMLLNPGLYTLIAFVFILVATSPYFLLIGDKGYFVNNSKALSGFIFITVLALGFSNLGWIAISAGYEPSTLLTMEGIGLIATESTIIRYQSGETNSGNPVILALSLWLIFRLSLDRVKYSGYKIGMAFLPLIGYTLLTTEKFSLLLGLVFYVVGALSFGSLRDHMSTFLKVSLYSLLLTPILGLSMLIRGHVPSDVGQFLYQLLSYVFFQYYGLGFWLVEKYHDAQLMFGSLTFAGPLSALDIVERKSGIYDFSYSINGLQSNIYTAYRNISEDFSIYFPFIFNLFVAGLYIHFHNLRFKSGLIFLKIYLLFFVLLSFSTTPFVYSSVALAVFLCLLNVQLQMNNISRVHR
jgi:hypothetical protein